MANRSLSPVRVLDPGSDVDMPPDEVSQRAGEGMLLEHTPIAFANYPYEWAPRMLLAAASLTIQMASEAVEAGFMLKDATPYNIMFEGARPVFLDLLSFKPRDPREGLWRPWAQFTRTFVYPLLASRYFGLRLDEVLLSNIDGVEPERMARLCPAWRLLLPPFLGTVSIPALLSRRADKAAPERFHSQSARDAHEARFLLDRLFRRAQRILRHLAFAPANSAATRYLESDHVYGEAEWNAKEGS